MREQALQFRRTERRHMIRVKDALRAALAEPAAHPALAHACVDHLRFIVGRFLAQGKLNITHLEPRIEAAGDEDGRRIIADLGRTLAACEAELTHLKEASDRLTAGGSDSLAGFTAAAQHFVAFYDSTLASHKYPAQDIIHRHFIDGEYWALTDDITDEIVREEERLFSRIVALAPAAIAGVLTAPWPEAAPSRPA